MNDLRVNLDGDTSGYEAAIEKSKREATSYADWWKKQIEAQKQAETAAVVEAAKRSNQARRLWRQRAQQQEARETKAAEQRLADDIEAAHRRNLARRLMRERRAAREERQAREAEARRENSFAGRLRNRTSTLVGGVGASMAGFFTVGAMVDLARRTTEYAGRLTDMAARTGVSVEALQRFDKAARENGTTLDSLIGFWERLGTARANALKDPKSSDAKAFERLGVTQQDLKTQNAESITRKIAEQFQNTTNVEEIIAPLREIGGRGVGEIVALFRAGLDQQYQDMQVMTGEQAAQLDELDDKWSTLTQTLAVLASGPLIWLIDRFRDMQGFFEKLTGGIQGVFAEAVKGDDGTGFVEQMTKGFKTGWKVASDDIANTTAEETKERSEKVKRSLNFSPLDLTDVMPAAAKKKQMEKPAGLQVDSLAKIGGFTASTMLFNPALNVAVDQLKELKEINRKMGKGGGINEYFQ